MPGPVTPDNVACRVRKWIYDQPARFGAYPTRKHGSGAPGPHPRPGPAAPAGPGRGAVAPFEAQLRPGARRPVRLLCRPAALPVTINGVAGGPLGALLIPSTRSAPRR